MSRINDRLLAVKSVVIIICMPSLHAATKELHKTQAKCFGHERIQDWVNSTVSIHDDEGNGSEQGTKHTTAFVARGPNLPQFPTMKR